ncbi:MAG: hypothetical protein ACJ79E_05280 [Anaeromyxobacteraceae bacterium]
MKRTILSLALFAAACGGAAESTATTAAASRARTLFVQSAVEHADFTVTLPLHRGTSQGRTVYYVVLDSSSGDDARAQGVNRSQKLANARGSRAVQKASIVNGAVDFPGTVDFAFATRSVVAGPQGFPPAAAQYGAQGDARYSPIVELPDGTVENAPHVANDTGTAPKVVSIDFAAMTVTMEETAGFQGGKAVRYLSTDSSLDVAAALENVTFAPLLNEAPTLDDDSTASSRTSLAAFVNGRTGAANPERQGLASAILDGLSPLNVLRWNPSQGRYSPLWDVHLAAWTPAAIAAGQDLRQRDYGDVLGLASHGLVTAPDGSPFGASNFIVNCPIISSE